MVLLHWGPCLHELFVKRDDVEHRDTQILDEIITLLHPIGQSDNKVLQLAYHILLVVFDALEPRLVNIMLTLVLLTGLSQIVFNHIQ